MSKKHKHSTQQAFINQQAPVAASVHTQEYSIIKHDLVRVVVLNLVYLAALLALFYSNSRSHYLEAWFSKILHF